MKKLLLGLILSTSSLAAYAQTLPSPTFNSVTLQKPLAAASGGTGSATAAGALSNLAGNPAAGTYSLDCTSAANCTTVRIGAGPFASIAGSSSQVFSVAPATTATEAPQDQQTVGGAGTSYVNETTSRSIGTTFTNSTGAPIFVIASTSVPEAIGLFVFVNGTEVAGAFGGGNGTAFFSNISFIVPNGDTYEITQSGSPTLISWFELEQ